MAANLRFVMQSAERLAHELSAQGTGDGLPERGLAHTRRADETEDGFAYLDPLLGAAVFTELLYGQVFQNAVFNLFKIIVVLVERDLGLGDIDGSGRRFVPREAGHPFEIGADDGKFGRCGRKLF